MFLLLLVLIQFCTQPISSKELQISPKRGLLEILSVPRNYIGYEYGKPNNLRPINNFIMPNTKCVYGEQNIITPNRCTCSSQSIVPLGNMDCNCQKQLNSFASVIGYGTQRPVGIKPIKCSCKQNIPPITNHDCIICQQSLTPGSSCGCKRRQNTVNPLNTLNRGYQRNNNLMLVNIRNAIPPKTCGCGKLQRQNYLIPSNKVCSCNKLKVVSGCNEQQMKRVNIGCGCSGNKNIIPSPNDVQNIYVGAMCSKQNIIPPNNNGCNCQRQRTLVPIQERIISNQISSLPIENELSYIDLPVREPANGISGGKDFLRRTKLFDLSTRLENIADLALATANLISILPTNYDISPFGSMNDAN